MDELDQLLKDLSQPKPKSSGNAPESNGNAYNAQNNYARESTYGGSSYGGSSYGDVGAEETVVKPVKPVTSAINFSELDNLMEELSRTNTNSSLASGSSSGGARTVSNASIVPASKPAPAANVAPKQMPAGYQETPLARMPPPPQSLQYGGGGSGANSFASPPPPAPVSAAPAGGSNSSLSKAAMASVDDLLAELQGAQHEAPPAVSRYDSIVPSYKPPAPAAAPSPLPPLTPHNFNRDSIDSITNSYNYGGNRPVSTMSTMSMQANNNRKKEDLDQLLNSLGAEMSEAGVESDFKGTCAFCRKPVMGPVTTALGKVWHQDHFACFQCRKPLGTTSFFEKDGNPYCEKDYHDLFSPRCAYCDGAIRERCVQALNKSWHPEHFFCSQCGKHFNNGGFMEKDGKAYCEEDYFNMFAPKCGGCEKPIMADCITALNRQWHPSCFACMECKSPFENGSFFDHEGKPYCETHFHSQKGSLCQSCQKPVIGRCITALGRRFHPEHFVCAFCTKQLQKGTFKENTGKPYCVPCHVKLFG